MMTQPTATTVSPALTVDTAVSQPAPKSFWQRADEITGFVLFMAIVAGGIVTPFAFYLYGLMFR